MKVKTLKTKLEKIMQYSERHNVDVYGHMPPGYGTMPGASTAPVGSVWICDGKSRFGGERKTALLLEPWLWKSVKEYPEVRK